MKSAVVQDATERDTMASSVNLMDRKTMPGWGGDWNDRDWDDDRVDLSMTVAVIGRSKVYPPVSFPLPPPLLLPPLPPLRFK